MIQYANLICLVLRSNCELLGGENKATQGIKWVKTGEQLKEETRTRREAAEEVPVYILISVNMEITYIPNNTDKLE